jgi:hypothetical protein
MRISRTTATLGFLAVTPALGVHLAPTAGDGLSPVIPALRHDATMAWTHVTDGTNGFQVSLSGDAQLTHAVGQSPGSPSSATTSMTLKVEDSDGFQPANILVSWPIGDPLRGVRAHAQTTSEITQLGITGILSSAREDIGGPPGGNTAAGSWYFRLDPTGGEIAGEPVQIRAFASIDGQVGSSKSARSASRVLADFTVNGETVLASETITDETLPNMTIDESSLIVVPASIGGVVEIGFSVRTDASVLGAGPRAATGEAASIRFDLEFRLIRELADLNNDGVIDTADLGRLIANFGLTGTNYDLNADGIIDTADLGLLISVFGMPSL